jgi:hypothetical protein
MWIYLKKLIGDLKFEELQQISFTKNFIKSCKYSEIGKRLIVQILETDCLHRKISTII